MRLGRSVRGNSELYVIRTWRAAAGAVFGAFVASAALAVFTFFDPSVVLDFDADLPRAVTSGFYPVERTADDTFAWTTPLATITLRGLDRDQAWRCTARLRGARPAGVPEAVLVVGVDGVITGAHDTGSDYQEVGIDVPSRRGAAALSLTLSTNPAFVPGSSDTRPLGVQVDRVACAPSSGSHISAPPRSLAGAAIAGALFGAVFALVSSTWLLALLGSSVFAAALAFVLGTGVASYSRPFLEWITPLALWIAAPVVVFSAAGWWSKRPLHVSGSFVLAFSSAVLFIKILTLLHPSKDVVDAVFHAHRLEWVLSGRYYFTQPMPGGVQFPYAIGLYLTAAPWAGLVRDHVVLLRIVVCVAEAIAALTLYVVASRIWNDRLAGAIAVVLYHLAPLPYIVLGNANLTYAFGNAVAIMTVSAAATLALGRRHVASFAALSALASLAFLSHVGVFPILAVTLVAASALYWSAAEKTLRPAAVAVLCATVLAGAVAVGTYYAHFPEVYRTLNRVTMPAEQRPENADAPASAPTSANAPAPSTIGVRAVRAVSLGLHALGWPMLALAAVGVWLVWAGPRDRATLAIGGWGASFVVFVAFRIFAPVDARYQRYADELIDRVYYATLPAVALLAGRAAASGWRGKPGWRLAVTLGIAAAAVLGVRQWIAWII